jgi:hypothetical protein
MSYTEPQVSAASSVMEKYRGSAQGEAGAALVVVGLSAERAAKEVRIRDDMDLRCSPIRCIPASAGGGCRSRSQDRHGHRLERQSMKRWAVRVISQERRF